MYYLEGERFCIALIKNKSRQCKNYKARDATDNLCWLHHMRSINENEGVEANGKKPTRMDDREDKMTMSDEGEEGQPPEEYEEASDDEDGWRCVML